MPLETGETEEVMSSLRVTTSKARSCAKNAFFFSFFDDVQQAFILGIGGKTQGEKTKSQAQKY